MKANIKTDTTLQVYFLIFYIVGPYHINDVADIPFSVLPSKWWYLVLEVYEFLVKYNRLKLVDKLK